MNWKDQCVAILAALLSLLAMLPAEADPLFQQGVQLYNQKNFTAAAPVFERCMQSNPGNANVIYYCALSHHGANNVARARQLFQYLADTFPATPEGTMARTALAGLGAVREAGRSESGGSLGARTHSHVQDARGAEYARRGHALSSEQELASLPPETRIPFTRKHGGGIFVEVLVNNQPIMMHVDTGAPNTVFGENHMHQLGVNRPPKDGKMQGLSGVGDRSHVDIWFTTVDLKLGPIYRRNFEIKVQDSLPAEPLLGQTFFKPFEVTIDDENRLFVLRKKSAARNKPPRDAWCIPFRWIGGHMIVDAYINGKPYEMIFDTGADKVALTMSDLKRLNLDIPANYRAGMSIGTGGTTRTYQFQIDSIKLGPIVQEGPWISVVEKSNMDRPLLGQSFFGAYSYTIDNEEKLIRFKKGYQ